MADSKQLPDGVWRQPFTENGAPVVVAVVDGERLGEVVVTPDTDIEAVRSRLWAAVDGEVGA